MRRHQFFEKSHNFASPSPLTDGRRVVRGFGNGEPGGLRFRRQPALASQPAEGLRRLYDLVGPRQQPRALRRSGDLALHSRLVADLPGKPSPSYVVAHDVRNGNDAWKMMRMTSAAHENCDSYITPILWKNNDRLELVVLGGQMLNAYDPATGNVYWQLPGLIGSRTITGAVAGNGMIFATQGMRQPLLAVRPRGDGRRTREDVVWHFGQGTPDCSTPVVSGKSLFFVTNDGIARCLDTGTGRVQWKERLKGEYRASPVAADDASTSLTPRGLPPWWPPRPASTGWPRTSWMPKPSPRRRFPTGGFTSGVGRCFIASGNPIDFSVGSGSNILKVSGPPIEGQAKLHPSNEGLRRCVEQENSYETAHPGVQSFVFVSPAIVLWAGLFANSPNASRRCVLVNSILARHWCRFTNSVLA